MTAVVPRVAETPRAASTTGGPADAADAAGAFWALTADAGSVPSETRDALAGALLPVAGRRGLPLLVTCHRVELYGTGAPGALELPEIPAGVRLLQGRAAVRHLLRVAAGLESAVVGEDQILAQLRAVVGPLQGDTRVDPRLDRLAQTALATGRRARHGSGVRGDSLARRGVAWLESHEGALTGRPVLVVGTGTMGTAAASVARHQGARVTLATRDPARAKRGPWALDLTAAARRAPEMAGIVIALAGPWHALGELAAERLPRIVDLSSPSAVPTPLRQALGDRLLGIDALYGPSGSSDLFVRRAEAEVERAEGAFLAWLAARPSTAAARRLLERGRAARERRLEAALRRLPQLDERGREVVRQLAVQLTAELLHEPLARLGHDTDGLAATATEELYEL